MSRNAIVCDIHLVGLGVGVMLEGVGPFGLSSQGDGAMPRTTWRASTSKSLHPIFKNRFNQVPSVTEYPLIKRIRTDTTIDLSKILPRRVTWWKALEKCHPFLQINYNTPDSVYNY